MRIGLGGEADFYCAGGSRDSMGEQLDQFRREERTSRKFQFWFTPDVSRVR